MRNKKGFTILEVIVLISIFSVAVLFAAPYIFVPKEKRQEASIRANVAIAASAVTSRFALKKADFTAEQVAVSVVEHLNKTTTNPYDKNSDAYAVANPYLGTVVLTPDNSENLIQIEGYTTDPENPLQTKIIRAPKTDKINVEQSEEK